DTNIDALVDERCRSAALSANGLSHDRSGVELVAPRTRSFRTGAATILSKNTDSASNKQSVTMSMISSRTKTVESAMQKPLQAACQRAWVCNSAKVFQILGVHAAAHILLRDLFKERGIQQRA